MTDYKLIITMTSDWHVGLGGGQAGNIDSLIRRDRSQLPFIPAKTLTGIWRDAAEKVALGLDGGEKNGVWNEWVDYLFGEQRDRSKIDTAPRPAVLSVRPARFPDTFQEGLKDRPQLREALTFTKPGIAIDSQTGVARDDFLRFEEMARGGAVLAATYSLDGELKGDKLELAEAFLTASASYIKRLGGKRRRGVGRCAVSSEKDSEKDDKKNDLKSALAVIEKYVGKTENGEWKDSELKVPKPPDRKSEPLDFALTTSSGGNWHSVELTLELKSPLLLHKRTVGNTTETLDYLPGTYLLAILSKRLRKSKFGKKFNAAIARGDVIATHAYLEVEGTRGRPVPFAWFSEKLNEKKYYNLLHHTPQKNDPQIKGTRAGYVGSVWESPELVKKEVTTHNTVEDESQRPSSDVGGVYSYEAISPGTVLRSQLRVRGDLTANSGLEWLSLLNGIYRVGRTSKDDYGLVEVEVEGELDEIRSREVVDTRKLTVWLLSDVLLRDKHLRPTVSLEDFREELQRQLGVELKQQGKVFARQNRLESWQTRWGLPRPSLVGLAAGTCVVYEITEGDLDLAKLAELESGGIGDRRAEGYGQLCFNDKLLMEKETTVSSPNSPKNEPQLKSVSLKTPFLEYAQLIEEQAWRKAIDKKVLELAADKSQRDNILDLRGEDVRDSKPSLTQLGALRSLLRKLKEPEEDLAIEWIKSVRKVQNRKDEWGSSLDKVEVLVEAKDEDEDEKEKEKEDEELVWRYLELSYKKLTMTEGGKEILKKKLWSYAVWVLVDACTRAHKRDLEEKSESAL